MEADLVLAVNTVWVIIAAALVFLMHAGFACVEAGFTQSKKHRKHNYEKLHDYSYRHYLLLFCRFFADVWGRHLGKGAPGLERNRHQRLARSRGAYKKCGRKLCTAAQCFLVFPGGICRDLCYNSFRGYGGEDEV